jgi:hypothetical protein
MNERNEVAAAKRWASGTFEFGGDRIRFTGRGIRQAEYFVRMANDCSDSALGERIFRAMWAVMVGLWAEGSLSVEELHRRMAAMKQDNDLLAQDLPLPELLDVIQRTSEHMRWFAKNDPNPERRARQAAQLTEWEGRMAVLLDRLGRPSGSPVLRRRRLA